MKLLRSLQILLMAGTLTTGASASDDLFPLAQHSVAETHTAEADASNDDSGSQAPSDLDRRDRIYYPGDTERPKPLLRKLFLNIVLDQKEIFTSPFHVSRHNALDWIVPMAVTGALIAGDTRIADSFQNSRGQVRWGGRVSDIGASYTLIPDRRRLVCLRSLARQPQGTRNWCSWNGVAARQPDRGRSVERGFSAQPSRREKPRRFLGWRNFIPIRARYASMVYRLFAGS